MFEGLRQADIVLDACGREVAPPGYKFVDISYIIPMKATFTSGGPTPFQIRVKNNGLTVFRCMGIVVDCILPIRIKWPTGRYLAQGPSWPGGVGSPFGAGGNLIALDKAVEVNSGANIVVEVSQ